MGAYGEVYDTYEGSRLKSFGLFVLNCEALMHAESKKLAPMSFFNHTNERSMLGASYHENMNASTSAYHKNMNTSAYNSRRTFNFDI